MKLPQVLTASRGIGAVAIVSLLAACGGQSLTGGGTTSSSGGTSTSSSTTSGGSTTTSSSTTSGGTTTTSGGTTTTSGGTTTTSGGTTTTSGGTTTSSTSTTSGGTTTSTTSGGTTTSTTSGGTTTSTTSGGTTTTTTSTTSGGTTTTSGGTTAPSVTLTASVSTISPGGTTTLTWSSAKATTCSAAGGSGFTGTVSLTGNATITPSATTTYTITCSGTGGSKTSTATVSVSSPPAAGLGAAFANPDNGNIPDKAKHPYAFPTALGFGRVVSVRSPNAVVYKINSLDDIADPNDGKITYRECVLALAVNTPYAIPSGRPRYCIFDVAGQISLQSPAWITTPKVYIAGQSSPGGIELRLGANYDPVDSLIDSRRGGTDVIVRHIRARTGEHPNRPSDNGDALRLNTTDRQIIDHVTAQFGTDESMEADCTNCTIQWSIIGPNICRNAGHSSALHCKTFFLKPSGSVTVAYNLSQHGVQRGINLATGTAPAVTGTAMQADIFNNVVYHYTEEMGLLSNQFGSAYVNYMNNVALRGPRYNGQNGNYFPVLYNAATSLDFGFSIYMSNNVTPRTRVAGNFGQTISDPIANAAGVFTGIVPSTICGVNAAGAKDCTVNGLNVIQTSNYVKAPGNTQQMFEPWQLSSPEQAMRNVLAFAGADLCREGPCRDNVDSMYIDDVRTCDTPPYLMETDWTTSVAASGGWAVLSQGASRVDTDNDGMPDAWEKQFSGTNPNVWDANNDPDGDGYPNIEEYLNALAQDDIRYSGIYTAGAGSLPKYNCNRPML